MDDSQQNDTSADGASSFLLSIMGVLLGMLAICGLMFLLN